VKPVGAYLHFEGTYRGVYRGGKVSSAAGTHTFKDMDWVWLEVTPIKKLTKRNVEEECVLDFYFAQQLPTKSMLRMPWTRGAHVILVGPEKRAFTGTIYDVVMWQHTMGGSDAEITIKDPNGKMVAQDALEMQGAIRFSIPDSSQVISQPALANIKASSPNSDTVFTYPDVDYVSPKTSSFADPILTPLLTKAAPASPGKVSGCAATFGALIIALLLLKWMPIVGIFLLLGLIANAIQSKTTSGIPTQTGNGNFGCLTTLLLLIGIGTCIHAFMHVPRTFFYAILFVTLCYLISRIQTKAIWRVLLGILFILTMLGYWSEYFHFDWQRLFESRKSEGQSTINPPIPIEVTDKNGNKKIDSLYHHEIHWDDFSQRSYVGIYSTTLSQFDQSNRMHNALAGVEARGDVRTYWSSIYQSLVRNDQAKLDSIVHFFEHQRDSLQLNPTETAEAVVTFIQEIPYYLLHDGTCEEAMSQGNSFMTEYHVEGKPCLAGVVAGLQSPYEFVHNHKGDCDTRSILCHTLLSRLGVPSSVWVSEVYGHSIIGIGVAASGNNYKTINGQRHFATELTAKGFRAGMISPDHTDMDNWLITITNP
jgi:energy-coupling factor transporter transmembrane protein EcfT